MDKKYHNFGINFEAFFLGPQGENFAFYKKLLDEAIKDHCEWRNAYHLDDREEFITKDDKLQKDFRASQKAIEDTLNYLKERLKKSQPFFSPRYIGHMNWEVMFAPIIAFFCASLYNPNNVAKAGSTGTSDLELEVGQDFVKLFGFDPERGWGHICTGGTIANMEALWIARNMKVIPLVLKEVLREYGLENEEFQVSTKSVNLSDLDDQPLLKCLRPAEIIDLKESVLNELKQNHPPIEVDDAFDRVSMQGRGLQWKNEGIDVGIVFMSETKHYSLKKAMDLLGIGRKNIRYVPVDKNFRMDMKKLEEMIFKEVEERPILAVVGILGSTEESAVDEVDKIVKIREKLEGEKSASFHIHVDAAYGGYARSLFLDENGHFMNKDELDSKLKGLGIIGDKKDRTYASWPHQEVFHSFEALSDVDTITVDPHKLGYVLYPAGGIAMRDRRMRDSIQTFAPYVFRKPEPGDPDDLIGSYILEGSKPGAAAAAVWTAHRILPLNIKGYGKLIGETIDGAQALWFGLHNAEAFPLDKDLDIDVHSLTKPDINIVNYVFNFCKNDDLKLMNKLTEFVADKILGFIPPEGATMLEKTFIVSSTDFSKEEYGNSPVAFLKDIGIPETEWDRVGKVKIARSVIMSPYLTPDYVDDNYVDKFIQFLKEEIRKNRDKIIKDIWLNK